MDRTTRAFILASLVYLAAGGILGLALIVDPAWAARFRFAHVHLLLGGFMAMMVFGVGYFILPRFAGAGLRWPRLVPLHFWLANLSLVALVVARPLSWEGEGNPWAAVTVLAAAVQAASLLLFTVHLGTTLTVRPRRTERPAVEAPPPPAAPSPAPGPSPGAGAIRLPAREGLGASSPVAAFLDAKEGALPLLVEAGLRPLADPGHVEMVRRAGVTLGHACERHGIPLEPLLARLRALPDRGPGAAAEPSLRADDVIGQVVERHPETREVFRRLFGEGCFTCPGFATETLAQGALMHGVAVDDLIAELEEACHSAC